MFSSATFTIVVVDYKGPRLLTSFQPLGNVGNSIRLALRRFVVMIEGHIDFATFVIDSLDGWNYNSAHML